MRRAVLASVLLYAIGPRATVAQRLRQYNLWVCPHCERGVKAADVMDLKCEAEAARSDGVDWRWVKEALHRFLRGLRLQLDQRNWEEVDQLLQLATSPTRGECYLGIIALGYFALQFMEVEERRTFIRTTVFGGVTFQRAVPLSYWDVYASGWPIFGMLATASEAVQRDMEALARARTGRGQENQEEEGGAEGAGTLDLGMTGIDLGPRGCCDFPGGGANSDDRSFLLALHNSLEGYAWVEGKGALPLRVPLAYLAQSAHRRCSWGRAAAYFALVEGLLDAPSGPSAALWNSTKALVSLGEHNLDGCEPNTTVYHLMQSVWPFWHVLGRLEQRRLPLESLPRLSSFAVGDAHYTAPPALPAAVQLKWRHLLRTRGLGATAATAAEAPAATGPPSEGVPAAEPSEAEPPVAGQPAAGPPASTEPCLRGGAGLVHVALSADPKQIDGLIATLNSASRNAGDNASRLCFHAFVLPEQHAFVAEGLACAFGERLQALGAANPGPGVPEAFVLLGATRLLLHLLDAARVWRGVGLAAPEGDGTAPGAVMHGEVDVATALRSDTGDLGAVHNFARFLLHELLPGLQRVVYLDVDIIVRGDLCELYDAPIISAEGSVGAIAAVQRMNQPLRVYVDVLQPAVPTWVPSEAPSFNAGVMVIDLARWRERFATQLVAEWIALNARRRLWLHGSQPPLLLLFHDEVVPLHWTWNIDGLGHRLNYPKDVLRQARVLHWTGPLKPWKHHGVNRLLWEPYALEYCPRYSFREHTTTCRPDSWFC